MKLHRGKYRSRKSYKRATGNALKGSGYYRHCVETDNRGNRFMTLTGRLGIPKKYLLSAGALR